MSRPAVEDEALADYQLALTEWLEVAALSPEERTRRLRDDARSAAFAPYVATIDPRCVEVLSMLMARWGSRR